MKPVPKPHQMQALEFVFKERKGKPCLLAHDTGTGKTLTGIWIGECGMRILKYDFLVVGEPSLYKARWLPDWISASHPGNSLHGKPLINLTAKTAEKRKYPPEDGAPVAAYCGFGSLNANLISSLRSRSRGLVIVVDECHKIFSDTKGTGRREVFADLAALYTSGTSTVIVFLSATPVRNHPSELYPLLKLTGIADDPTELKCRFFKLTERGKFGGFLSPNHKEKFTDLVRPLCSVVSSEAVGFPPFQLERREIKAPPHLEEQGVPMDHSEYSVCSARLAELKLKYLADRDHFRTIANTLVFFRHRAVGGRLRSILIDMPNFRGVVDGSLPGDLRRKHIDDYLANGGILALSIGVGSEGYDICHPDGQDVDILELPWTWHKLIQIAGRVRRLSTKDVESRIRYWVWTNRGSITGDSFDIIADRVISGKKNYTLENVLYGNQDR